MLQINTEQQLSIAVSVCLSVCVVCGCVNEVRLWVDWKCSTWKWGTKKDEIPENAGPENEGPQKHDR